MPEPDMSDLSRQDVQRAGRQQARLWYISAYVPMLIVGLLAWKATDLPGWLTLFGVIGVPVVVLYFAHAAIDRIGRQLQTDPVVRRRIGSSFRDHATPHLYYVACYALIITLFGVVGVMVSTLAIGGFMLRSRPFGRASTEVMRAALPASIQAGVAAEPEIRFYSVSDAVLRRSALSDTSYRASQAVFVVESVWSGDPATLEAVLAYELARLKLGLWRSAASSSSSILITGLGGVLMIFALTGHPGILESPVRDASFSACYAAACFGIMLTRALIGPLILLWLRHDERKIDELMMATVGSGDALRAHVRRTSPIHPHARPAPKLFYVLAYGQPTTVARLRAADEFDAARAGTASTR